MHRRGYDGDEQRGILGYGEAGPGHPATVIMAVTNTDQFAAAERIGADEVNAGDGIMRVSK